MIHREGAGKMAEPENQCPIFKTPEVLDLTSQKLQLIKVVHNTTFN